MGWARPIVADTLRGFRNKRRVDLLGNNSASHLVAQYAVVSGNCRRMKANRTEPGCAKCAAPSHCPFFAEGTTPFLLRV
jgi:hypothetical protein